MTQTAASASNEALCVSTGSSPATPGSRRGLQDAPGVTSWLTVAQAAQALGCTERHVQRMCFSQTLAAIRDERGTWWIDPDCQPALRLAVGRPPRIALEKDPLAGLSAAQVARAHARYDAVRQFERALAQRPASLGEKGLEGFLGLWVEAARAHRAISGRGGESLSRRSLLRWRKALRQKGIAGLVDGWRYAGQAACSPEAWQFFVGLFADQAAPHVPRLWERVAALAPSRGWEWPSLRTVQRWAAERLDPKVAMAGRDPGRFEDRCVPFVNRDWEKVPAMGCWVADHRQLDVLWPRLMPVERKGRRSLEWRWARPWLTAYLDGRSWFLAARGMRFASPDGQQTMAVFIAGVGQHGQPEHLYLDNGKDFRMTRFSGGRVRYGKPGEQIVPEKVVRPLLDLMGIGSTFARPFNAKAKIIEPWFKLMAENFDKTWPTYCGRSTEHRPERIKAFFRHGGAETAESYARKVLTAEQYVAAVGCRGESPQDQEHRDELCAAPLVASFDRWLTGDYALRESPARAANGLSALRAFHDLRREGFSQRRPARETLLKLLEPSQAVRVSQNGIFVRAFGRFYWSNALEDLRCCSGRDEKRKIVYRYDPADPSQICVYDRADRFLAVATPYIGDGVSPLIAADDEGGRQRLTDAMALQQGLAKAYSRQVRDLREGATNILLESGRAAAEKLRLLDAPQAAPAGPAVIQLVPELDRAAIASRRARQAHEDDDRRQAALAATGTDDEAPAPRRDFDAAELLADVPDESMANGSRPGMEALFITDDERATDAERDGHRAD